MKKLSNVIEKPILISGKRKSGKNHVSKVIKNYLEDLGLSVEEFAFSDPIKQILNCFFFPV